MVTKIANRGLKARWPELEERVHRWVLEQRTAGTGLSTVHLRLHALVLTRALQADLLGVTASCNATASLLEHRNYASETASRLSSQGRQFP